MGTGDDAPFDAGVEVVARCCNEVSVCEGRRRINEYTLWGMATISPALLVAMTLSNSIWAAVVDAVTWCTSCRLVGGDEVACRLVARCHVMGVPFLR